MRKFRMGNITVMLLEDYEVNDSVDLAKDAIKHIRESNKHSIYFECLRDAWRMGLDFFNNGYTTAEVEHKNLVISNISNIKELANKMELSVENKGVKEIYFNFPDTIVDETPNLPDEYDFIALLMGIMIMQNKRGTSDIYDKVKFTVTVQRASLKSIEILDYPIE